MGFQAQDIDTTWYYVRIHRQVLHSGSTFFCLIDQPALYVKYLNENLLLVGKITPDFNLIVEGIGIYFEFIW